MVYTPFLARCRIVAPVIANDLLHGDGLLARAAVTEQEDLSAAEHLPLAAVDDGAGRWCWQASCVVLAGGETMPRMSSHGTVKAVTPQGGAIPVAGAPVIGPMSPGRPEQNFRRIIYGIAAAAFVGVGDIDEVHRLLNQLPGLGAMVHQGFGARQGEWTVQPLHAADRQRVGLVRGDDQVVRPLPPGVPAPCEYTGVRDRRPIRPPYWETREERHMDCLVPGPAAWIARDTSWLEHQLGVAG
jgi:CRISPR type IV-associated protein Csf3